MVKDRDAAIKILKALIDKGESRVIKNVFSSVLPKWQKKIIRGLEKTSEKKILEMLK